MARVGRDGGWPAGMRAAASEAEVKASGGVPSPAQQSELAAIKAKLNRFAIVDLVLLGIAIVTMATARYL
jgi:hypothetical protein